MGGIMTAEPLPDWVIPPYEGYTAEDLDRIPDLPPHTELIDGSLVIASPQRRFHDAAMFLLQTGLRASAPDGWRAVREMTVKLNRRNRPEPDVLVVRESAAADLEATAYRPDDVLLAVEVVSPDSEERDRKRKPQLYAEAGIPHFWRVEDEDGRMIVYTYALDASVAQYEPTGIHHDRLALAVPFPIDIDLTEITTF
ncbi:Uma2 family endonuclease [Streptacidiphilus sp. MAP12-20]|uniref:Uma2 family endonuclease n=1 Tax=Streptacidiphilus sp. MAP12-20 TaxID=3156299 RepID=UPI003517F369